jgi:hypothetical protein
VRVVVVAAVEVNLYTTRMARPDRARLRLPPDASPMFHRTNGVSRGDEATGRAGVGVGDQARRVSRDRGQGRDRRLLLAQQEVPEQEVSHEALPFCLAISLRDQAAHVHGYCNLASALP